MSGHARDLEDANIINMSDGTQYADDWHPDEIFKCIERYRKIDGGGEPRERIFREYLENNFPERWDAYLIKYPEHQEE